MLNLRTFYDVYVPVYVCMYALCMELSFVHGKCPNIGFWMSGHVMYFFLQGRGVERATETRRNFCFWLPLGLPRHAHWRGNVCLPRHPLGRGSPGQHGCRMSTITQDCRATLHDAAKRHCRAMKPGAVALPCRV
jgi:hypothetical protein